MVKLNELLQRVIKFSITGFIGVVLDFSITFMLKEQIGLNPYLSNLTGVTCAIFLTFYVNRAWTFKKQKGKMGNQLMLFFFITIIGCGWNCLGLFLFQHFLLFPFYLAKLVSTGLVATWNFTLNSTITFKGPRLEY